MRASAQMKRMPRKTITNKNSLNNGSLPTARSPPIKKSYNFS
jgi:hypothetical protein